MTLDEWFRESGWTQERLARAANLGSATVRRLRRGSIPSPRTAKRIEAATAGAVTTAELLGFEEA